MSSRPTKLPYTDLIDGPRLEYLEFGVPLYKASVKGDLKLVKFVLDKRPELVSYAITENWDTALHLSASTSDKKTHEVVQYLVHIMTDEDLALKNVDDSTAFYVAAAAGNITALKIMMKKNKALMTIPSGIKMPLIAAAWFGYNDAVNYLYENTCLSDDIWKSSRNTLFEKCVENNIFDIAQDIAEKYPEVAANGNALRILASKPEKFSVRKNTFIQGIINSVLVFLGLKKGAHEKENSALLLLRTIWKPIAKKKKDEIDDILRGPSDRIQRQNMPADRGWSDQVTRLLLLISEYVVKMNVETNDIGQTKDYTPVSEKGYQALRLASLIYKHLAQMHDETHSIIRGGHTSIDKDNKSLASKEYQAVILQKLIFKHIEKMHKETDNLIKTPQGDTELALKEVISKNIKYISEEADNSTTTTFSSRIPFIAAKMGNTNFIVELIRQYPDLVWQVDDEYQTIFHIAVKNRNEDIYNLLYEIGSMKDFIIRFKDKHGNNLLHLAGMSSKQKQIQNASGVGLQMQRETLWFREVERMVPPSYRQGKNADNLTPHELFAREHKGLVKEDEKWMTYIAGQSMLVATLIATIGFTAAYTIPGGYNQDDGIPIFHSSIVYKIFVVADAISLLSSTTSILYIASLFILYQNGTLWIPILIGVIAFIPFFRSFMMQNLLVKSIIQWEYGSRHLFKPKKAVLYYKNPQV
ncbi:uncharacterized protein [Rutidosis leptorrhynchoides]|uniref:uncharacterized protein isoform X2 n=1 Tax=Rutidosis leptorrhynchoides TaxID=125765 RepID=UPI003A99496B